MGLFSSVGSRWLRLLETVVLVAPAGHFVQRIEYTTIKKSVVGQLMFCVALFRRK